MKIWLMNRFYHPYIGGIESSLFYISKALHKQGHEVTILTQQLEEETIKRKEYAEVCRYEYKENKLIRFFFPLRMFYRYLKVQRHIKWCIKEKGLPDLVIVRDPVMGWACKKSIGNGHMIYVPPTVLAYNKVQKENTNSLLHYIVMRIYLRQEQYFQEKCFRNIPRIVVFSNNVKMQIMKRMKNIKGDIRVIHPGCDEKFFKSSEGYVYEKDTTKFLFVGRLVEDKNLMMVLKALKEIDLQEISFHIVGDGMQRAMLEDYVRDNNMSNIHFVGKSDTPELFFASSDFFIIPSKYEAFGQVISESLSSGTPVVGFKTIEGKTLTAVEELVENNETGFIIKEYSVEGIKDAIYKAIVKKKSSEEYMVMREQCRQFAEGTFNWDVFANKCIE